MKDSDIVNLLRHLRTSQFGPALARTIDSACSYSFLVVLQVCDDAHPTILFSRSNQEIRTIRRLPTFHRTRNRGAGGASPFLHCRLNTVTFANNDDLSYTQSAVYQSVFAPYKPVDVAFFSASSTQGSLILLAVGRTYPTCPFSEEEKDIYTAVAPAICALMRAQWESLPLIPTHQHLVDVALSKFGRNVLTMREQEVVRRILLGRSTKAIALELSISDKTAKVHRRNAYAKLSIKSQAELFGTFLSFLSEGSRRRSYHLSSEQHLRSLGEALTV